jgi:uncharacterized small protein (DUF1192 family)
MALLGDEPVRKPRRHEIGQDLSALSVDELGARIEELNAEIARLEAERKAKGATKAAADALFRQR